MTEVPNHTWKLVVRSLRVARGPGHRAEVEKIFREAAGLPYRLRDARRSLFLLTGRASNGTPAMIETENGLVCVVGLGDLLDVVLEPGPTLYEVMHPQRAEGSE